MGLEIILLEKGNPIQLVISKATSPALRQSISRSLKKMLDDGSVKGIDKTGKRLVTGSDVLNAYLKGNLTRSENAKVVQYLFKTVNDSELRTAIAQKIMSNPRNIEKYSKLTSKQATTELTKLGYTLDEIKFLKNIFIKNGKTNNYGFKKPGTITPSPPPPPQDLPFTDINFWIREPKRYTNDEIQSFLKTLPKNRKEHSNIINIFNGYAKYMKNSTERLKQLIDQRKVTSDIALKDKIDTEINKELKTIFTKRKEDFGMIIKTLDEIAATDKNWKEVWGTIKKEGNIDDMYSTLRNLGEKIPQYKKVYLFLGEVLSDFWDVIKATYNIIGKKIELPAKTKEEGFKNVFSTGARIGLPIKGTNKLYDNTFKYGGKTAAYSRYAANLIQSTIVFNLTLSFLNNSLDGVANLGYWDDIKGYSEEIKRGESGPYTEKMKNLNMVQKFLVRRALNYRTTEEEETNIIKKVLLDAVTTEVKENGLDNILQYTKYFPGRWDDIVYIIVSTINTLRKAIDDLKYREQFISNLKSYITRIKKEAEDTERQLEVEVERVQERTQTTKPGGTLEDFKDTYMDEKAKELGNGRFQHSDGTIYKWDGTMYDYE
jgi:hypothetical protein